MDQRKDQSGGLECRVNMPDGTSEVLVPPESGLVYRFWKGLKCLITVRLLNIWKFLQNAWEMAVSEPRKVIHCLKLGVALSVVSLLYYLRPLYDGYGGNAMWAIMTVVVVFEQNIGATLSKCINRGMATLIAGLLALGIHWIARHSGKVAEPVILGVSVFLFASAASFSRFIPAVKARFDYGAVIFILTFSLVSVSGYHINKLFEMAHQRLSTIAIGTSLCIIINMSICPIWAGDQLHLMIHCNLDKLAQSLKGCAAGYFKDNGIETTREEEDTSKHLQGYKCMLNSKAAEESLANFAAWEPAHGQFNFRHPWRQYLKIGDSMRHCAYCIDSTLSCCISSSDAHEQLAPESLKKQISEVSMVLSSHFSNILTELANTIRTAQISSETAFQVGEMNLAVEDLKAASRALPSLLIAPPPPTEDNSSHPKKDPIPKSTPTPLGEVLRLATVVSTLIEIASRIQEIVDEVHKLASLARFRPDNQSNPKQNHPTDTLMSR